MKIVHISKNDLLGGAARSAYRLHQGLRQAGYDSSMVVASRTSDDPTVVALERPMDVRHLFMRGIRQAWIARGLAKYEASRPMGYELFSDDRSTYSSTLREQLPACDIVNLHWVPGLLDYASFLTHMPLRVPIVWTLHDMNPLTGGCHYNLGCTKYLSHCTKCPQLGSAATRDPSYDSWSRKHRLFSSVSPSRLHVVTPSKWLSHEASRSPVLSRFPTSLIPYGLDLDDFAPRNRAHVRDLLQIPHDARVLLFLAEDMANRRKGFSLLIDALARAALKTPNLFLLSLGRNLQNVPLDIPSLHVKALDNDRFLSMVYSAADVFAICSLQDNLPNTVLEAMACGIPVVGHAVGGIPDMVAEGLNGLTVAPADVDGLAAAISALLNDRARCTEMGVQARRIAIAEYSSEIQARRYAALYDALLRAHPFAGARHAS